MSDAHPLQHLVAKLSSGFILAFHEIAPARLAELVDCIWPCKPVPLPELVDRSKRGKSSPGLFAITVDDGVGQNVTALSKLFHSRSWPATFYLPTQYIDTGQAMAFQWWRAAQPLLPREVFRLRSGVFDLSSPAALRQFSEGMRASWHTQRLETYLPVIMELADVAASVHGIDKLARSLPAPVTWTEIEQLSKTDLIRFESHGMSHTAMSALTEQELAYEMRHSRDTISEHTGYQCRHLTYPFGSRQSIGAVAPLWAKRFYDSATTLTLGCVDGADPWLLPRIPLYPDTSLGFARLKIFLKCNVMSPIRKSVVH